jgi:hypothetical protein
LISCVAPLAVLILSANRLPIYLLPVYPVAAIVLAAWVDQRAAHVSRPARALGWLFLIGVIAGMAIAPFVPDVKESGILLLPGIAWKLVPFVVGQLVLGVIVWWALNRGRPALLVYGGAIVMAVLLMIGARLNDEAIERTQDFRVVAAALARHAGSGDARLFSASLLLPVDFYYGRQLDRMFQLDEFRAFIARPDRPIALIDRRYWRDFQKQFPPDVVLLEKIPIQGQDLYIVRGGGARG